VQRITIPPRSDWEAKVEALGLVWHTASGAPYWNESAYYAFTASEIDQLEAATRTLYGLFLEAGQYVIDQRLYARFGIPDWCWPLIEEAWNGEPPALNYGRFDLGFDGRGAPKLFEFNCDTPTSLVEAAVIQWAWKEERFPDQDQFNSLHDKLVAKWRDIAPYLAKDGLGNPRVHFTHMSESTGEDATTTAYLMDTAKSAGLVADRILIADIGWDGRRFLDLSEQEIRTLYHLYPWEWLVKDAFGVNIPTAKDRTLWIEPIWKMIWSNKAILPILWDLFPRHENLLWATRDRPAGDTYVQKPILAREGANVRMVKNGQLLAATDGAYAEAPVIYQGLFDVPDFDGARPVVGGWIVDGEPAGIGVREDGLITGNLSRFVPHILWG